MYIEIEKKAIITATRRTELCDSFAALYGEGKPIRREDYYLINKLKQEVRVSIVNYLKEAHTEIELTCKDRIRQDMVEVNLEYILICNNSTEDVLNFWKALDFTFLYKKIKKYIEFKSPIFKIALVDTIEWEDKQQQIHYIPNSYLEVECLLLDDISLAQEQIDALFKDLKLDKIEEKRYIELVKKI